MAQVLKAILARQWELTQAARNFTGDINEAGLLVGRVVSLALGKWSSGETSEEIADAMWTDLERLMEQAQPRPH